MPQFAFIAKDRMGNTVQGNVDAADTALAANQIGQMGYELIELRPGAPYPADQTMAMSPYGSSGTAPAQTVERTQVISQNPVHASAPPAGGPGVPARPATVPTATAEADLLRADVEKRRKVEMDLARMGMKPDEIKRLLDANPNTTAPSATSAMALPSVVMPPTTPAVVPLLSGKKQDARQKLAARAADLHSFAAQLQSSTASDRVEAVKSVSLDLPPFRTSTPQERQQAEPILREVYALRKRERYTEALAKCRDALELVPSDAAALEMFGDLLQGVARTNEALAAYKRAIEADPKRASAERKYGDLLTRQQQWSEVDPEEVPRNPVVAAILSLLLPGAGQIHNGQRMKGVVLLTCAAVSVAVLLFLMRDKQGYLPSYEKPASSPTASLREKRVAIDWIAEAPMISCILFYGVLGVGSAFDAAAVAQRTRIR